jgi:hypothetical protein
MLGVYQVDKRLTTIVKRLYERFYQSAFPVAGDAITSRMERLSTAIGVIKTILNEC